MRVRAVEVVTPIERLRADLDQRATESSIMGGFRDDLRALIAAERAEVDAEMERLRGWLQNIAGGHCWNPRETAEYALKETP